jgi:hypothetical protein
MSLKNISKAYNLKKSLESIQRKRDRGFQISTKQDTDKNKIEIEYNSEINISIPFTGEISKNTILGRGNFGKRVFMKQVAKDKRSEIAWLCKQEMIKNNIMFYDGKVYLDIFVQKPTAGAGDALNVLDLISDAVQDGIGVNDKWFCVKSIDWEIKKDNPMIHIQVLQEVDRPHQPCSYCGVIRPMEHFTKRKNGYSRDCLYCRGKML